MKHWGKGSHQNGAPSDRAISKMMMMHIVMMGTLFSFLLGSSNYSTSGWDDPNYPPSEGGCHQAYWETQGFLTY